MLIQQNRHRNITVKRLLLDFYQFVRAQSFAVEHFGKQFQPSRDNAEIDITYKCNLKCINCNRSCTQAPSDTEMKVSDIEAFIRQSVKKNIIWKRIRILGGEPTLHSRIFDIMDLLSITVRSIILQLDLSWVQISMVKMFAGLQRNCLILFLSKAPLNLPIYIFSGRSI